jgi:rRNA pseudouridine-1189 N-methylase Emg1 (Nep1/Mra1 family)
MFYSAKYSSLSNDGLLSSLQISAKNIQNEIESNNKKYVIKMCEKLFKFSYDELDNKKKECSNNMASIAKQEDTHMKGVDKAAVIGEKRLSCNKQCKKIIYSFEEKNQSQIILEVIREKIRFHQYQLLLIE